MDDKQELIDIIETVYRGASKGRGLVVSPKGMQIVQTQSGAFYTNLSSYAPPRVLQIIPRVTDTSVLPLTHPRRMAFISVSF